MLKTIWLDFQLLQLSWTCGKNDTSPGCKMNLTHLRFFQYLSYSDGCHSFLLWIHYFEESCETTWPQTQPDTLLRNNTRVFLHLQGCPSAPKPSLLSSAWPLMADLDSPKVTSLINGASALPALPRSWQFLAKEILPKESHPCPVMHSGKDDLAFLRKGLPVWSNHLVSQLSLTINVL